MDLVLLRVYLDRHYREFDYAGNKARDPCTLLERFRGGDPRELEVTGFLAASLAYGRVDVIRRKVGDLLERLGESPYRYVRTLDPVRARRDLRGFRHRFHGARDVTFLMWALGRVYERWPTLEDAVLSRLDPAPGAIGSGLAFLMETMGAADPGPVFGGRTRELPQATRHLLASPDSGSSCKRILMFTRWMVRRPDASDGVDFGVWTRIHPRSLVIPLDTHTSRIVRYLGLTRRRSPGYAMAAEVTGMLRRLDEEDPVKYDFALAHIGISRQCLHRRIRQICGTCPLDPVCTLGAAG